jgi:GAF domain-containing protein
MQNLSAITQLNASEISLSSLTDWIVESTGAARGTVFVIDEAANQLYFNADTAKGQKQEMRITLSRASLTGTAILDNITLNVPDCYKDERFDRSVDKRTGFRTTQLLCVPVASSEGKLIGAIEIINSSHGMPFTNEDAVLLKALRVFVEIAIMNLK